MRNGWMIAAVVALGGCQALPGRSTGNAGDALARLATALPGEYDNHEQVQGYRDAATVAVPRLRETWKPLGADLRRPAG